jgi:catechol 2,3-dioxygenase-like lactoylglutathione lyase family enzyme
MTIRNLQHIALAVPDLAAGARFYADFGLEVRAEGRRAVVRCVGRDQDQVILVEGARKRMQHVAFGTDADGLEALRRRLAAHGVKLVDAPKEAPGDGLWFRDPWDSLAEYFCDIDYIPDGMDWKPTNYPAEDSLYVWGPKPPEAFGANFEQAG